MSEWPRKLRPDLDDLLLALGLVSAATGAGLILAALVSIAVGVGGALLLSGTLALAGGVLLGRSS